MASRKKAFDTWIRKQVWGLRDGNKCVRLVLRHLSGTQKVGAEVTTFELSDRERTDELVDIIRDDLTDAAEHDATGFGGVQTYIVQAVFEGESKPVGRFPIRASGDSEDEGETMGSEPATTTGMLTQMMRHNEAIMRTHNLGLSAVVQQLSRYVERQGEQIDKLLDDRLATVNLIEDLHSRRHERELELAREQRHAETAREAVNKIGSLVPHVVNKLAGKKALPAPAATTMALKELFTTMTQEQLEGMRNVLTQEQLMLILSLASEHLPKEEENA